MCIAEKRDLRSVSLQNSLEFPKLLHLLSTGVERLLNVSSSLSCPKVQLGEFLYHLLETPGMVSLLLSPLSPLRLVKEP